jgi:hypothetical protein
MIILSLTEESFTLIRVALTQMEGRNHSSQEEAIAAMLRGEGGQAQDLLNDLLQQYQSQAEHILETSDGQRINVSSETETHICEVDADGDYRTDPL